MPGESQKAYDLAEQRFPGAASASCSPTTKP
jgi:hypothetical protein